MNIDIIIFATVIFKKIKIIFTPIQQRCFKNSQRITSNSSSISDYVNIVEITLTQHYTRIAQNRFPEQILGNNTMETASTEVTPIRRRNNAEKSTWKAHRYFVDFESQIHVEISTSNRCHNFHVDSPFKIDVIQTNFPREMSTSNRWPINEDVSIGMVGQFKIVYLHRSSKILHFLTPARIQNYQT